MPWIAACPSATAPRMQRSGQYCCCTAAATVPGDRPVCRAGTQNSARLGAARQRNNRLGRHGCVACAPRGASSYAQPPWTAPFAPRSKSNSAPASSTAIYKTLSLAQTPFFSSTSTSLTKSLFSRLLEAFGSLFGIEPHHVHTTPSHSIPHQPRIQHQSASPQSLFTTCDMLFKSSVVFAVFAFARLAVATPPACLLAAIK